MTRLAALTGATGFLGRHVAQALAAKGWRLRCLVRSQPGLPSLRDQEVELVQGDLADADALAALARGADLFIHIAGLVKARSRAEFNAANMTGAFNAAKAWRDETDRGRFILISTLAAREPQLSDYAGSKRAGEDAVSELLEGRDFRIIRPSAIYGSGDQETLKVLKASDFPCQFMLNRADARIAMIEVRDAAEAIAAAAEVSDPGAVHELSDQRTDGYTWRELAETAAEALGRQPRPVRLPAPLLRLVATIGGAAADATGRAEMLTPGKAREILHPDWSIERPLPEDVFAPTIDLAEGLRRMAAASGLGR